MEATVKIPAHWTNVIEQAVKQCIISGHNVDILKRGSAKRKKAWEAVSYTFYTESFQSFLQLGVYIGTELAKPDLGTATILKTENK